MAFHPDFDPKTRDHVQAGDEWFGGQIIRPAREREQKQLHERLAEMDPVGLAEAAERHEARQPVSDTQATDESVMDAAVHLFKPPALVSSEKKWRHEERVRHEERRKLDAADAASPDDFTFLDSLVSDDTAIPTDAEADTWLGDIYAEDGEDEWPED